MNENNHSIIISLLAIVALFGFFFALYTASAATTTIKVGLPNPLGGSGESVQKLIESIVEWLVKIGAPIAALMVIIGAFQMLFSGGSPDKFKQGMNTILYTAIGYGVILVAWGIVALVENLLK